MLPINDIFIFHVFMSRKFHEMLEMVSWKISCSDRSRVIQYILFNLLTCTKQIVKNQKNYSSNKCEAKPRHIIFIIIILNGVHVFLL